MHSCGLVLHAWPTMTCAAKQKCGHACKFLSCQKARPAVSSSSSRPVFCSGISIYLRAHASQGSCGFGNLNKAIWPFWSVAALSTNNPLYIKGPLRFCGCLRHLAPSLNFPLMCIASTYFEAIAADGSKICICEGLNQMDPSIGILRKLCSIGFCVDAIASG